MNIKEKWIAALKSGEYKQGTGCLRDADDNYCCLGVLGDIAGLEWSEEPDDKISEYNEKTEDYSHKEIYTLQPSREGGVLPLDFTTPDGREIHMNSEVMDALAIMNDEAKADFETIARAVGDCLDDELQPKDEFYMKFDYIKGG